MDISKFGKGAVIVPIKLQDYRLEVATAVLLPPSYSIKSWIGVIKDQDGSGSCVSQATSYHAEVLNYLETQQKVQLSPRYLYSAVHLVPEGSSIKDNMAYLINNGIATEFDCPSYALGSPPSEAFMENGSDITDAIKERAKTYVAKSYVTWNNKNIDSYKQAIKQGNGCIVAVAGNNYCWANADILPLDSIHQAEWHHGIYLIGWDDAKQEFEFVNSWGTAWGDGGFGRLPYAYVTQGYVSNAFTLIDLPNTTWVSMLSIIQNLKDKIAKLLKK